MIKYYVDAQGNYLGSFDGAEPPAGAIEVEYPPLTAKEIWFDGQWIKSKEELKELKQSEIDALEASLFMTRGEREGWIAMILAQASTQSVSEPNLYLANPFYKKLKDVNTTVTQLRAELKAL